MVGWLRRVWAGEVVEAPTISPPAYEPKPLPPADADDGPFDDVQDLHVPNVVGRGFIICYVDGEGEASERRIVCHGVFEATGRRYLRARCLERGASRRFRVDRIEQVFCGVTGEDLGSPARLFHITEDPPAARPKAPSRSTAAIQTGIWSEALFRSAVQVLVTLCRCDGSVLAEEHEVVERFISAELPSDTHREDRLEIFRWAIGLQPSYSGFVERFSEVAEGDPALALRVLSAAVEVVMADGNANLDEQEFVAELDWVARRCGLGVRVEAYEPS